MHETSAIGFHVRMPLMLLSPRDSTLSCRLPSGLHIWHEQDLWRTQFSAFGCVCQVLMDTPDLSTAKQAASIVCEEALRIEHKYSRQYTENVIHTINTAMGKTIKADEETERLLDFVTSLYWGSNGLFDITTVDLRNVWRFNSNDQMPDTDSVRKTLKETGWHCVQWEAPYLQMPAGMQIDVDGLCKQYAVDTAASLAINAAGVPMLINFGGDMVVRGSRPEDKTWKIAIDIPACDLPEPVIELTSGGIATSNAPKDFLLKGEIYHGHIMDRRRCLPVNDAPRSVIVHDTTCSQAGVLATLAVLHGAGAEEFLRTRGVVFWIN
jgi:FAD:protein FMN transferase